MPDLKTAILFITLFPFTVFGAGDTKYEGIYKLEKMENAAGIFDLPTGTGDEFHLRLSLETATATTHTYNFELAIGNTIMSKIDVILNDEPDNENKIKVNAIASTRMYPGEALMNVENFVLTNLKSCQGIALAPLALSGDDKLIFAGDDVSFIFGQQASGDGNTDKQKKGSGKVGKLRSRRV
jgi:hypothetical protein